MTTRTQLAKISKVSYGFGGYDDAMFGVSFTFSSDSWGVGDFWGWWPLTMQRSQHCKWSEDERINVFVDAQRRLEETMKAAKVKEVHDLIGIPVEVTIERNCLASWRVLTEVL